MDKNKKMILWITHTAVMLALLIAAQAATAPFGITLLTGSLVNMILIVSVMTGGLATGLAVAVLSPAAAKLFGIGPLWSLIPFIAPGNCVLILLWHCIVNRLFKGKSAGYFIALGVSSVCKFLVLYLGIVRLMIPLFLHLPDKQASVISAAFSVSQLFTALIGGAVSIMILPVVRKAIKTSRG